MSCNRYRELLSRYVDGEVTLRQRNDLLAHVQQCPHCSAWLARVRQTDVLLKGGMVEDGPSDRVRAAVLNSVRNKRAQHGSQVAKAAPAPRFGALHLGAAGLLLRFEPSPRLIAVALAASFMALMGLGYWLNILPPLTGYNKLGFEFPGETANASTVNATPLPAMSSGIRGVGGTMAVPNLLRVLPADGARDVPLSDTIRIRFDLPMDRASVESALQLDPPVAGLYSWDADNEVSFSSASNGLLRGITYTVVLSNSARSLAGTPMERAISWRFHTRNPYLVSSSLPMSATVAPTATFTLNFAAPMVRADRAFSLEDESTGQAIPELISWAADGRSAQIMPGRPLSPGKVYLRVGADLPTQWGDTLGRAYEFVYNVDLPKARLRMLDGRVAFLSANAYSQLRYGAVSGDVAASLGDTGFELYALPAEYLSAISAQSSLWPSGLPSGLPAGLSHLQRLQPTPYVTGASESSVQVPPLPAGTYLLVATASAQGDTISDWQLLVVSDGALTLTGDNASFWATDQGGHSWSGAEVSLYSPAGNLLEKGVTDKTGLWLPSTRGADASLAIARDTAGHMAAAILTGSGKRWSDIAPTLQANLQTDRPDYRPGQQVNFRLLFETASQSAAPATPSVEQDVSVLLLTPTGAVVSELKLKPDSVGGVSGLFTLSPELRPGLYTIRVRASGGQRDFPLQVTPLSTDTLSVYLAPGPATWDGSTSITRTVSVLGANGEPASGALLTATLGIDGDSWASTPVVATTDSNGRASISLALPAWASAYNEPGLYIRVESAAPGLHGSASQFLDLTSIRSAQLGTRQLVSPGLDLAAIAMPAAGGAIHLRLVRVGEQDIKGDTLVLVQSQRGKQFSQSLDLSARGGDVTLTLPGSYAGGKVSFYGAGVALSRELALLPKESADMLLRVTAQPTVVAGTPVSLTLSMVDSGGESLAGTASLRFERVAGSLPEEESPGWEPSISLEASGPVTATVASPASPGLWYMLASAATPDGRDVSAWSVIQVLPGPHIQLPPPQKVQVGTPHQLSIAVYNPDKERVASDISASVEGSLRLVGDKTQSLQIDPVSWNRLNWQVVAGEPGLSGLALSFSPNAHIAGYWNLDVQVESNPGTKTSYASGVLTGEQTVGVVVPSGIPEDGLQLEVRASTSLLPTLASIAAGIDDEAPRTGEEVSAAAARLSNIASVAAAYRRTGSDYSAPVELSSIDRSLLLQQLYSWQQADGGWRQGAASSGASQMTTTAEVLLAMRRESLSWADGGSAPQPAVDSSVISRGLDYLLWQMSRPIEDLSTTGALDERAYSLYVLSLYGALQPESARPLIAYTSQANGGASLSSGGKAWLALALWQSGDTEEGALLINRLVGEQPGVESSAQAPILEGLITASSTARQGKTGAQDASTYDSAAMAYARSLMESRQGTGWRTPSDTADALWALAHYAVAFGEKALPGTPILTLNDHPVDAQIAPRDGSTVSMALPGSALHPGTNWLKLKAPASGQPLYYSLTLRATR
ncbi:MAG: Ig-like domain-containing protein [Chloroflexi bacterium]|nr:Ig-like domain-containing protein [Chloroflexota bacterium]